MTKKLPKRTNPDIDGLAMLDNVIIKSNADLAIDQSTALYSYMTLSYYSLYAANKQLLLSLAKKTWDLMSATGNVAVKATNTGFNLAEAAISAPPMLLMMMTSITEGCIKEMEKPKSAPAAKLSVQENSKTIVWNKLNQSTYLNIIKKVYNWLPEKSQTEFSSIYNSAYASYKDIANNNDIEHNIKKYPKLTGMNNFLHLLARQHLSSEDKENFVQGDTISLALQTFTLMKLQQGFSELGHEIGKIFQNQKMRDYMENTLRIHPDDFGQMLTGSIKLLNSGLVFSLYLAENVKQLISLPFMLCNTMLNTMIIGVTIGYAHAHQDKLLEQEGLYNFVKKSFKSVAKDGKEYYVFKEESKERKVNKMFGDNPINKVWQEDPTMSIADLKVLEQIKSSFSTIQTIQNNLDSYNNVPAEKRQNHDHIHQAVKIITGIENLQGAVHSATGVLSFRIGKAIGDTSCKTKDHFVVMCLHIGKYTRDIASRIMCEVEQLSCSINMSGEKDSSYIQPPQSKHRHHRKHHGKSRTD